jgi:hypothetical protein
MKITANIRSFFSQPVSFQMQSSIIELLEAFLAVYPTSFIGTGDKISH